ESPRPGSPHTTSEGTAMVRPAFVKHRPHVEQMEDRCVPASHGLRGRHHHARYVPAPEGYSQPPFITPIPTLKATFTPTPTPTATPTLDVGGLVDQAFPTLTPEPPPPTIDPEFPNLGPKSDLRRWMLPTRTPTPTLGQPLSLDDGSFLQQQELAAAQQVLA